MSTHSSQLDITLLFQDLLSPSFSPSVASQLSYHISTHPLTPTPSLTTLTLLFQYLIHAPSLSHSPFSFLRAQTLYNAILVGVQYRLEGIADIHGKGWLGRRQFAAFLDAVYAGVFVGHGEETSGRRERVRVLVLCAVLKALQGRVKGTGTLDVAGSAGTGRAEKEVLRGWAAYFDAAEKEGNASTDEDNDEEQMILPWLASQTLPLFPVSSLSRGPISALLPLLIRAFSRTFSSGTLFSSLSSSLVISPSPAPKLHWTIPSPSHTLLSNTVSSPLFVALGPLSRAIARCLEAESAALDSSGIMNWRTTAASDGTHLGRIGNALEAVENIAIGLREDWGKTDWSDVRGGNGKEGELELDEETKLCTFPWEINKSFLFSITLLLSSLLTVVSSPRSSYLFKESSDDRKVRLGLTRTGMRILAQTYFVATEFGPEGFSAWKGVWMGLMEVLLEEQEGEVEVMMRELEPRRMGVLHQKVVERSQMTFWLNVAEQLMKPISDEYVKTILLPSCRPYLENPQYRDTFESAHSVLLAVFSCEKQPIANEIAPWYTKLLLTASPKLMTAEQVRLAFTKIIQCASTSDDSLSWYCLTQLSDTIRALPPSSSISSPSSSPSPSSPPSPSPRVQLLQTLIEQLSTVNLVLLRSLLGEIWTLVKEEREEVVRKELGDRVFKVIGEGLDAGKRGEGVRWWLERGGELFV